MKRRWRTGLIVLCLALNRLVYECAICAIAARPPARAGFSSDRLPADEASAPGEINQNIVLGALAMHEARPMLLRPEKIIAPRLAPTAYWTRRCRRSLRAGPA